VRRALALVAFISVALLSIALTIAFTRQRSSSPDWPDYAEFLAEVRNHTATGDSIALLVPARRGTTDYSYAYFRASYDLAGREVLPVISDGTVLRENIARAGYVAVWHGRTAGMNRPVVWRGHGGELLGR
jgi:hypothetical protein